jgi:ethanolamine transporter EutH
MTSDDGRSLEAQRAEFSRSRFLAMPLAGTLVWALLLVPGALLPVQQALLALYIGTGCIAYLGMFLSRFTGEHFLDKSRPKNVFQSLFFHGMAQAVLVYAIAVPFALIEPRAAPMGVGILAGLMWIPFSWIIQHPIGWLHTLVRTALITASWFLLPDQQYTVVPLIVIACYLFTIPVLELRWRRLNRAHG